MKRSRQPKKITGVSVESPPETEILLEAIVFRGQFPPSLLPIIPDLVFGSSSEPENLSTDPTPPSSFSQAEDDPNFELHPSPPDDGQTDRYNKYGCVMVDDVKEILMDGEIHSDHSQEEFLKRIGAKVSKDTYTNPPVQLPTAKKHKRFEVNRKVRDDPRIPHGFWPLKGLKTDPKIVDRMRRCASLATDDYNTQQKTKYRLVDVDNVGWQIVQGMKYYIIFQAMANGELDTFATEVIQRRVGRGNLRAILVHGVRIKRPESSWLDGTLQELVN